MPRGQCPSLCLSVVCDGSALWSRCMPGRGEGSSRAMLATARPSCFFLELFHTHCRRLQVSYSSTGGASVPVTAGTCSEEMILVNTGNTARVNVTNSKSCEQPTLSLGHDEIAWKCSLEVAPTDHFSNYLFLLRPWNWPIDLDLDSVRMKQHEKYPSQRSFSSKFIVRKYGHKDTPTYRTDWSFWTTTVIRNHICINLVSWELLTGVKSCQQLSPCTLCRPDRLLVVRYFSEIYGVRILKGRSHYVRIRA